MPTHSHEQASQPEGSLKGLPLVSPYSQEFKTPELQQIWQEGGRQQLCTQSMHALHWRVAATVQAVRAHAAMVRGSNCAASACTRCNGEWQQLCNQCLHTLQW